MRSSWVTLVGSKYNDRCPHKRQKRDTDSGERHVKGEAEMRMIWLQAEGHLGPPEAGRGQRRVLP